MIKLMGFAGDSSLNYFEKIDRYDYN